jgi:hypothetical protein
VFGLAEQRVLLNSHYTALAGHWQQPLELLQTLSPEQMGHCVPPSARTSFTQVWLVPHRVLQLPSLACGSEEHGQTPGKVSLATAVNRLPTCMPVCSTRYMERVVFVVATEGGPVVTHRRQITAAWLTATLRTAGHLPSGNVATLAVEQWRGRS